MHSRAARLSVSALAWIALGAAAFFTFDTQQQINHRRAALRAFESTARDASDALDDAQAGQQAYVAAGQEPRDWLPKVATFLQTASSSIDSLRASAQSPAAGPALLDASTAMTVIGNVDRRVRQQLADDDVQGAADAVFSEGADAISSAVSNVGTAIAAEQQAADAFETWQRLVQLYALGGAAGFVALVLAILGLAAPARPAASDGEASAEQASAAGSFASLAHEAVFDKGPDRASRRSARNACPFSSRAHRHRQYLHRLWARPRRRSAEGPSGTGGRHDERSGADRVAREQQRCRPASGPGSRLQRLHACADTGGGPVRPTTPRLPPIAAVNCKS
jgi:hypothetical protein